MLIYYNEETYQATEFGDDSIRRESKIVKYQLNNSKPSYFKLDLMTSLLKDNTNWLDIFGSQDTYFYSQGKQV